MHALAPIRLCWFHIFSLAVGQILKSKEKVLDRGSKKRNCWPQFIVFFLLHVWGERLDPRIVASLMPHLTQWPHTYPSPTPACIPYFSNRDICLWLYLDVCYSSLNVIGYDTITFDMKAPITDACIFVQFHYVDNKWDPCDICLSLTSKIQLQQKLFPQYLVSEEGEFVDFWM